MDPQLIAGLSLPLISRVSITTPTTAAGAPETRDQFDVSIFIPSGNAAVQGFHIPAMPIITTDLRHQGIDGLLGRDVLRHCTLTYIGSANMYSLSY